MKGIILQRSNYTYEGDIVDDMAHGKGVFQYANGDTYRGECQFGKPDGYGVYTYKNDSTYTGFFSYGKFNGIGTYEDAKNVYKGTWRFDNKHGTFHCTKKSTHTTYLQKWLKNRMIEGYKTQYIRPEALQTTKKHPHRALKLQRPYNGKERQCMGCYNAPTNATSVDCGHVMMCYECLCKCDRCPMCRAPINRILKLFIS